MIYCLNAWPTSSDAGQALRQYIATAVYGLHTYQMLIFIGTIEPRSETLGQEMSGVSSLQLLPANSKICTTFVQRRLNVFDVGPTFVQMLYKCFASRSVHHFVTDRARAIT